jgi:hypothetical protein
MSIIPSRRAVLAGIPAALLPVAAVSAIPSPDAELIELGKQMDHLIATYEDARRRSKPNWDAWNAVLAKFGARHDATPGLHITNEEYIEAGAQVDRDFPIAFPTTDDVMDKTEDPSRRIMALPAYTLAGLAVKAKVAKFGCSHIYRQNDEYEDWDRMTMRSLIDGVLAAAVAQS